MLCFVLINSGLLSFYMCLDLELAVCLLLEKGLLLKKRADEVSFLSSFGSALSVCLLLEKGDPIEDLRMFCIV